MRQDEKMREQDAEQRGWADVAKQANFTVGPGTIAGCIADGVGDPRIPPPYRGGDCEQASTPSASPSRQSTRHLLSMTIAKLRAQGQHECGLGARRLSNADALESLMQSLPQMLSQSADEGLRVLLGFGNI